MSVAVPDHSRLDHRAPLVLDTRELGRRPGALLRVQRDAPAPGGWAVGLTSVPADTAMELDLRLESVLDGVLVEKMGQRGVELIVGARNDADWGPVLMVGLGWLANVDRAAGLVLGQGVFRDPNRTTPQPVTLVTDLPRGNQGVYQRLGDPQTTSGLSHGQHGQPRSQAEGAVRGRYHAPSIQLETPRPAAGLDQLPPLFALGLGPYTVAEEDQTFGDHVVGQQAWCVLVQPVGDEIPHVVSGHVFTGWALTGMAGVGLASGCFCCPAFMPRICWNAFQHRNEFCTVPSSNVTVSPGPSVPLSEHVPVPVEWMVSLSMLRTSEKKTDGRPTDLAPTRTPCSKGRGDGPE